MSTTLPSRGSASPDQLKELEQALAHGVPCSTKVKTPLGWVSCGKEATWRIRLKCDQNHTWTWLTCQEHKDRLERHVLEGGYVACKPGCQFTGHIMGMERL